jgi:hypothetical protein
MKALGKSGLKLSKILLAMKETHPKKNHLSKNIHNLYRPEESLRRLASKEHPNCSFKQNPHHSHQSGSRS